MPRPGNPAIEKPTSVIPLSISLASVVLVIMLATAVWVWATIPVRRQRRELQARNQRLAEKSDQLRIKNADLERRIEIAQRRELERRAREEQALHSQRLESLGMLAGGIAHDFNNLLVGIMGSAELARTSLPRDSATRDHLDSILMSSERAAELCRQMLAYAGKAPFSTQSLDLRELVLSLESLLATSIDERINLDIDLSTDVQPIGADRAQIEQVVLNLVINAAEAIANQPGTISIRTGEAVCDRDALAAMPLSWDVEEGTFAFFEISDTGPGIPEDIQPRIFDPFYTTKFLGRGLGLAAVFGILRRHGGFITVESSLASGSAFRVYLPLAKAQPRALTATGSRSLRELNARDAPSRGNVLIVDDERVVREFATMALERDGFTTVLADDGSSGVESLRSMPGSVDCVLLDMTMPRMDGATALRAMREVAPEVPVIVMSGHSADVVEGLFEDGEVFAFLPKPFALDQLQWAVNEAMGEEPAAASSF